MCAHDFVLFSLLLPFLLLLLFYLAVTFARSWCSGPWLFGPNNGWPEKIQFGENCAQWEIYWMICGWQKICGEDESLPIEAFCQPICWRIISNAMSCCKEAVWMGSESCLAAINDIIFGKRPDSHSNPHRYPTAQRADNVFGNGEAAKSSSLFMDAQRSGQTLMRCVAVDFHAKSQPAKNLCCHAAEASAERSISLSPPNMSKQIRSSPSISC